MIEETPRLLDDEACYAAMQAHDARFDGLFFCGVSSTRIYCRPVCRVRPPAKKNCTFFASAAAAEAAGYRPCLRCRPELAPGLAPVDSRSRLAGRAALIMEEGPAKAHTVPEVASTLGITDRHLRRVFFQEYGVTPVQYLQTRRLLLAKSLLADTRLSVAEVALSAGFGSIRRFNDQFARHYRLTPLKVRNGGTRNKEGSQGVTLMLGYRPPFAWASLLAFLGARAIPGVENVEGNAYRRTVAMKNGETIHRGWISVTDRPKRNALAVTVATTLLPVLSRVLVRVRQLFDLTCSPEKIRERLDGISRVVPGVWVPGIRVPGCFDGFEIAVRAILGQQVTLKAASTLAARLANAFGERVETPFEGLSVTFPDPERICGLPAPIGDRLGPLGITGLRARSIAALAEALSAGSIALEWTADPAGEMEKLSRLPGLGPWTVQYIAMRALGWPDAFPSTDYGVRKALPGRSPKDIVRLSEEWRPWRSYATVLLWHSLGNNHEHEKVR